MAYLPQQGTVRAMTETTANAHEDALRKDVRATRRHAWLTVLAVIVAAAALVVGVIALASLLAGSSASGGTSSSDVTSPVPLLPVALLPLVLGASTYRRKPKGSSVRLYVAAGPLRGVIRNEVKTRFGRVWTLVADGGARLERSEGLLGRKVTSSIDLADYEIVVLPGKVGRGSYLGLVRDGRYAGGFWVAAPAGKVHEQLAAVRGPQS